MSKTITLIIPDDWNIENVIERIKDVLPEGMGISHE